MWNSSFILLIVINSLQFVGFTMIIPVLPKYAVDIGASLAVAGLVAGIFSFTALIARPIGGAIADRVNKKKLIIGANIVMAAALLGYSVSASMGLLFFFRIVHGAAFAVSNTTTIAWATTFMPKKRLGEGIGYLSLSFILAQTIGPALGLWIAGEYGFKLSFFSSLLFLLSATALISAIKAKVVSVEEQRQKKGRIRFDELIAVKVLIFAALAAILAVMSGQLATFIALIGEERRIGGIALYFTVVSLTLLFIRPIVGKLSDRIKLSYLVYPAFLFSAAALVIIAQASQLWMILIAAVMVAMGGYGLMPALQATCVKKLGPTRAGQAVSTHMVGTDIGMGLGPILGGMISGIWGYAAMLYMTALLMPLGMIAYCIYSIRSKE